MALDRGRRIGPYEVISPLGSGGMGEVYRARDTRLGREVAVKVLPEALAGDASLEERFFREARAVAALSHPNVLTLFDVGIDGSRSYAVMELLEGETLRVRAANAKLPWQKAVELAAAIADGLAAAHARGIVHRDLKPENVMVTTDGRVKILDFGLARFVPSLGGNSSSDTTAIPGEHDSPAGGTEPGTVLGTYGYMSPEQARGRMAEAPADLFALGCILYELLAGRRAFKGETAAETVASVLRDEPAELTDVPGDLWRLIVHCLEKNPHERFQSARDLTFQLRGILSGAAAGSSSSSSRRPAIQSIAIVPFVNVGGDPDGDYLSEGIAESIITSLSRLPNLRVMSRTTMSRYKGRDIDPTVIGRELGVRALVSGRVRHSGDTLSVRVEMVHTEDGSCLWSESYNRKFTDILAIEEEIARVISDRLRLRIAGEDGEKLRRRASDNTEAYQWFLKGRFHCEKRSPESLRKGISHYNEAIALDPSYALAYAGIAEAYNLLGFYHHLSPRDAFPKARAAAARALELDPELPSAHAARAYVHFYFEWDWQSAELEYRRAIDLDPTLAPPRQFYAAFLVAMGRQDEAFVQLDSARELDPLGLPVNTSKGWCLFLVRRFEEGAHELRKVLEMEPGFGSARQLLGWCLAMSGHHAEAIEHLRMIALDADGPTFFRSSLAHAYAMAGETTRAAEFLRQLVESRSRRYVSAYQLAIVSMALGQKERAFHYLGEAVEERACSLVFLRDEPRLDALRDDPRFEQCVHAIRSTS